jgi:hypothetical protein
VIILVEAKTQLADIHANSTILRRGIVLRLTEHGPANGLFCQASSVSSQRATGEVAQERRKTARFLERLRLRNALDELPTTIC